MKVMFERSVLAIMILALGSSAASLVRADNTGPAERAATAIVRQQNAYDLGYSYGTSDRQAGRSKNYKRYKNLYNGSTKSEFKRGYERGYAESGNTGSNYGSVPNWLIGTFRGYTPGNSTYTQITVSGNGIVSIAAENGSGAATGNYNNGLVTFPWGTYRFKREGTGFRAINTSNSSDRVLYRRY